MPRGRVEALDLARGIAVTLMILSHGVKGLLTFDDIPIWGLVPIHLLTKLSSSLFILVFGMSLAVAYLPHVGTTAWPAKRRKLLVRGLIVFFWYKVLTIVEMFHLYSREDILNALLYRGFPVYVEILGFYALALLWIPWALPAWTAVPRWLKLASPVILVVLSHGLSSRFDFFGSESLRAILVEQENHYTWGQLARMPLVLTGLMAGELVATARRSGGRLLPTGVFASIGALLLCAFTLRSWPRVSEVLEAIARNEGKHPPDLTFLLFSVGGAFMVLAVCLVSDGGRISLLLKPVSKPLSLIGANALQAFVFHIFVLFVFYRFLFNFWHAIPYSHALGLTVLLIAMTSLWIKIIQWVRRKS